MISLRTYFVYINEKCYLLWRDPRKQRLLDYWMEGRIPGTSPDSPPPFGLYHVALMVYFGDRRYTDICVWRVSQWDDKNTVAEPLELKRRSAAEQQRCLDSVYEWVEAHPFERFKHTRLRGTRDHDVRVYDLPVPTEEGLRTWRAHYKRHQWVKEEWVARALALDLTGGEQTNEDQDQWSEQSDQSSQTESDRASGSGNEEPLVDDTQVNRTAMLPEPQPLQQPYTMPPAPAPSIFCPSDNQYSCDLEHAVPGRASDSYSGSISCVARVRTSDLSKHKWCPDEPVPTEDSLCRCVCSWSQSRRTIHVFNGSNSDSYPRTVHTDYY